MYIEPDYQHIFENYGNAIGGSSFIKHHLDEDEKKSLFQLIEKRRKPLADITNSRLELDITQSPPIVSFQGTKDEIERDYDLAFGYISNNPHRFKQGVLTSLKNVKKLLIDGD